MLTIAPEWLMAAHKSSWLSPRDYWIKYKLLNLYTIYGPCVCNKHEMAVSIIILLSLLQLLLLLLLAAAVVAVNMFIL